MFILEGKAIQLDTPFKTADGTQYPANWLRLSTDAEKLALGITEQPDEDMNFDNRFYWAKGVEKALEDRLEVKEDGTPLYVQVYNPVTEAMEDTTEQVVTKGLKSVFIAQVKTTAGSILAQTDWYVTRQAETGVATPTEVADYRVAIRAKANELESAISACATVEELAQLNLSFPQDAA